MFSKIESILTILDDAFGTRRKRHIAGGILISVSLLCGGLAATIMSLKTEHKKDEQ